jgi:hypothetical protein
MVAGVVFAVLGTTGGVLSGVLSDAAVQSSPPGTGIEEKFATSASAANFTVLTGGTWVSGNYVFTLPSPVPAAPGVANSNLVVDNTVLSGDWVLTARLSAQPTLPSANSYSLIFGLVDSGNYFYANFSQGATANQDGLYQVANGQATQLSGFPTSQLIAAGRNDDLTVTKSGTTVTVDRNGVSVARATAAGLSASARVGFGSRGSQVNARDLVVTSGSGTSVPTSTTTPTSTPSSTSTTRPTPTTAPTPTSTPSSTSTPTTAPTATTTPTPPPPTPSGGLAGFFAPAFSGSGFCQFSQQNATINGGILTVDFPAGSSAPSAGAPLGGAQLCLPFASGTATDATLSYDVRFPVGFQFVKGGKLPGMYGGIEPFSGGSHNVNGWSMRLMWRANGAAEVYGYISTTSGYGDDWGRGNFSFQADGNWHHLSEHVHLNTPGHSDGYVTLAYDGKQYVDQTGLAVTGTSTPIGGLFFSTFYGGHDATWSPTANMHIDFAHFGP